MQIQARLAALLLLASTAAATWTLANPPAATEDHNSAVAPCGGIAPADISVFTEWPNLGLDLSITDFSGPSNAAFCFRVALLEDGAEPDFGDPIFACGFPAPADFLCYPRIHGMAGEEWLGKKAVLQVAESLGGPGNYTYQCAGITFVLGDPAPNVCNRGGGK
ncbi:hypothetical protein GGR57DRAFT_336866 [Xylariaceae sp. FL1272]|nr:hypothetical protein GGR57DRAFT_336866 [Xylariaceae sp. FL1272]